MGILPNRRRLFQNSIVPGRPLLTAARWISWAAHCACAVPAVVKLKPIGVRIFLLPRASSFGSASIFIRREQYEPELLLLRHFVTPGSLAIDVGGSFGIYTIFLSSYVGSEGRVVTFEPGKLSYELLRKNIELNSLRNVQSHNLALSDSAGVVPLYHVAGSPVNFSLGGGPGIDSEWVHTVRMDDMVATTDCERLSFIKIDMKGYEPLVITGGMQTLEKSRPVVMFEVAHSALARAGLAPSAPYDLLETLGYRFFRLTADGSFEPCPAPTAGNIFAVPSERTANYPVLPHGGTLEMQHL
jgi:FkbM family methyltransferase